jgi:hypothetical protein
MEYYDEDYDNEGLIAFDDDEPEDNVDEVYYFDEPVEDKVDIGFLPATALENRNLLESVCPYIDIREIRALGRTSHGLWKELNKVWNDNLIWRNKVERLIGHTLSSDIVYDDWRFVYDIINDGNLRQLFMLKSLSMTKLALMLGADPSIGRDITLRLALESNNIDTIAVLLTDPRVDPNNTIMLRYLSGLDVGSPKYERIMELIENR